MPSLAALTIYLFGLTALKHGTENLLWPRRALAAKQLPSPALPALNAFSIAAAGIGAYYLLAAWQENRVFFAATLGRFATAAIFWRQGPAWRTIAVWEAASAGLTAVALAWDLWFAGRGL